tara:strand:- start:447 stop:893 length:447 start_codon:yes stop_codon:yes gene_type:complete
MVNARKLIVGFVVIGLFAFAFLSFAVNFQQEWRGDSDILNDTDLKLIYTGINDSFADDYQTSKSFDNSLYKEEVKEGGLTTSLLFRPILGIMSAFTGIAAKMFNVVLGPLMSALGLPQQAAVVVGSVLSTIFLIVTILLAWKLLRQGS